MSEVKVFAKTLAKDGFTTKEAMDFLKGIDDCLSVQASQSIINRFTGKKKWSKKARQIIYDTAMQIPIPDRFLNEKTDKENDKKYI